MRDSGSGSHMRALQVPSDWSWCGSQRTHLLLRALRQVIHIGRCKRPRGLTFLPSPDFVAAALLSASRGLSPTISTGLLEDASLSVLEPAVDELHQFQQFLRVLLPGGALAEFLPTEFSILRHYKSPSLLVVAKFGDWTRKQCSKDLNPTILMLPSVRPFEREIPTLHGQACACQDFSPMRRNIMMP